MHIVSVVTLLLGSIFAYTLAAPQLYPVNIAALSTALAQLAQQLAAQRNTTITVGNSSSIVSGVSSSIANAHIDGDRRPGQHQHNVGWNNGGWNNGGWNNDGWRNNNGWGYWRGAPEDNLELSGDEIDSANQYPEEFYVNDGDDIDNKDDEHLKF